ncbi:hypothetical protein CPB85DRAFT_1254194 [Mucidula mucida]|nr:hypothetical protein CPB85DRAFT_1254194 [Mucidula mucida]
MILATERDHHIMISPAETKERGRKWCNYGKISQLTERCEEQQEAAAETGSHMKSGEKLLSNSPNEERKVELAVTATDAQEGRWKLMESITLLRRVRSTAAKAAGTSPGEYELEGDEGPGRADRARAMAAGTSPGEYELEGGEGPGRADRGARQVWVLRRQRQSVMVQRWPGRCDTGGEWRPQ